MKTGKKDQERRRESAEACQAARAERSDQEQLDKLDQEGWEAIKERERLGKRMEVEQKG